MKRTISELFIFHSGSGALTERAIYNNQPKSEADMVLVLSGATDEKNNLPFCSEGLVRQANAPLIIGGGILVARKGQAGYMRLIDANRFTINDNAYVMTLKASAKDLINLQFFVLAYQDMFFDLVTSKDGNGTFAKSVAENLTIWLPHIETQRSIVNAWNKQENIKNRLKSMLDRICSLELKSARAEYEKPFTVSDLVNHFQGHQITDEELYNSDGDIPVFSGADARIKGYSSFKLVADCDLPCISYQTKGNTDVQINIQTQPFDANNTAVMTIKSRMRDKILLEYLKLPLRQKMAELKTSKESVSYIDTRILSASVHIPIDPTTNEIDLTMQQLIVAEYARLRAIGTKLEKLLTGVTTSMTKLSKLAISTTIPT